MGRRLTEDLTKIGGMLEGLIKWNTRGMARIAMEGYLHRIVEILGRKRSTASGRAIYLGTHTLKLADIRWDLSSKNTLIERVDECGEACKLTRRRGGWRRNP
jgi:hypothetical protein